MRSKKLKTQSDRQLVTQLQSGDKSAMAELYARYYVHVFNKCLSFAKIIDDASDMTHEIMLRVMSSINTFKGEAKFSTWLYAITFNFCTDFSRKRKTWLFERLDNINHLIIQLEESDPETDKMKIKPEIAGQALSAISQEDLNLLLMKYKFNKSIAEIQAIHKLSASAVKMRLSRARAKATHCYDRLETSHAA